MTAIFWPFAVLRPRNIKIDPAPRTLGGPASINGVAQVAAADAGIWTACYDIIPVHDQYGESRVLLWRAIDVQSEGRLNPILIRARDIRRQPIPAGVSYDDLGVAVPHSDDAFFSDGSGYVSWLIEVALASGAALRATTLSLTKTACGDLSPGHRFSLGERLYQIKSVTSQSAGAAVVTIWPPLREAVDAGDRLNFDDPVLRVRLVSDREMALPLDYGLWSFPTVNFVEDVA